MRNGQNNNKHRMRGRNRSSGGKSHNPLTRVYESNGPDVKIRGTANHVAEKYIQLARDATASGDPVAAENYYQHAEHYFRLIAVAQEQFRQNQPFQPREGGESRGANDDNYDDGDDSQPNYGSSEPYSPREQSYQQPQPQPPREAQPYQPREQREQPYQPRGEYQPRHERNRDNRQDRSDNRQNDTRQNETRQHDNRQHESRQPPQANGNQDEDVERLPSFITGAAPAPAGEQPNGGHEAQGDRFPLHRRRRRGPRGPRPEGAAGEGGDEAQSPPSAGE
jgi:hypothetical protein